MFERGPELQRGTVGYTGDGVPPVMTKNFTREVSERYVSIYEKITGNKFVPDTEKLTDAVIKK